MFDISAIRYSYVIPTIKLKIKDEAPILHQNAFDTADDTFQGILNTVMELACNYVFGGTTIVLGGRFQKALFNDTKIFC